MGVRGGEGGVFHRRCFGGVRLLVCLKGCGVVLSVGVLEGGCGVGGFPLSVHDVFWCGCDGNETGDISTARMRTSVAYAQPGIRHSSCLLGRFSGLPQLGHTTVPRSLNMEQYSHSSGFSGLSRGRISVITSSVLICA